MFSLQIFIELAGLTELVTSKATVNEIKRNQDR